MRVKGAPPGARPHRNCAHAAGQPDDTCMGHLGEVDPLLDVSIVIVSWNTNDILHACLESLWQNVGTNSLEIIVVDNGSCDGTVDMVTRDFPRVRLLVNSRNIGFAAANNRGLSRAHGRYLLL